jgi:hypothetical protein
MYVMYMCDVHVNNHCMMLGTHIYIYIHYMMYK